MNFFMFSYPFFILLILPILYCLHRCKEKIQTRYFVHLKLFSKVKKSFIKDIVLIVVAFILMLCALATPLVVDRDAYYNRIGKDIVLAIDASGSMGGSGFVGEGFENKALDRLSSRFEVAKYLAGEFIKERLGDNIGVVIYADFAFLASPITYEKEIVVEMLEYLTQGMAGESTAIGDAIGMSIRAFRDSKSKSKIIILLSDGEQNSGELSVKDATALAKEQGVIIYTVALGDEKNSDLALLEKVAIESGGALFYAKDAKTLQSVYEKIDAHMDSNIKSAPFRLKEHYYYLPLLMACGIMLYLLYVRQR